MTKVAAIYVRQSKESETSVSPETQETACRKLPALAGCDVKVYTDLGISGGKRSRKGFDAMLEQIREGRVAVVAAYNQSRLARSVTIWAEFQELMYEHPQIQVVFTHGTFDRTPLGKFAGVNVAAADQLLREMAGVTRREAAATKIRAGRPVGQRPYGYRWTAGFQNLEPDPAEAPVLQRIFNDFASGLTARQIADAFTVEGIPASGARQTRAGQPIQPRWMPDTVAGLLRNVAYIGKTYDTSRVRRTRSDSSSANLIKATWSPLVDDATFQRVQDRLNARMASMPRGGRRREFTFRGLLFCSECGRRFQAQHAYGVTWYRCGSAELPSKDRCAMATKAIREEDFLPWVDHLMTGFEQKKELGLAVSRLLGRKAVAKETATEAVAKVTRMIASLSRNKVTEDSVLGEDPQREKEYRAELLRLGRQRDAYAAMAADEPDPRELVTLAGQWRTGDAAQRRAVLGALFEKIHVRNRKVIGYTPRADRASRVSLLVSTAFDYATDGPGAHRARVSGKGGIRTLEGALHPLPA